MATVAPSRALIPDFAGLLATPVDPAATIRIEGASGIGWPLEVPEWIAMLERRLGRLWPANPVQSRKQIGTPRGKRRRCEPSSKLSP